MARRNQVRLIDDLDGSEPASTVRFGWKNSSYEIDLSQANAAALEKLLAPYTRAGRRVATIKGSVRPSRRGGDAARMRAWAKEQGLDVPDKGRLPNRVVDAYRAAHPGL